MSAFKVLLVSPNLGAHQLKKIRRGFLNTDRVGSLRVLSFERPIEKKPEFAYESLGVIEPRRYFARLRLWWRAFWRIRDALKSADVVFSFVMDCVFLCFLAKCSLPHCRCRLVYNIRDVHPLCSARGIRGFFFRMVDKILCKHADLVVVTSPAYFSGYIAPVLGLRQIRWLPIENKVPYELWSSRASPVSKPASDAIYVGYFGMMSYQNSWEIIKKAAALGCKFYLRGHNYLGEAFERELRRYPDVTYGGPYKNPEDMDAIFDKIDVSWAINADNFTPGTNDEWAMCNRFYEGLYFKKPLIVQRGCAHEAFVRQYDVGIVVDARDQNATARAVAAISKRDVERWQSNLGRISPDIFTLRQDAYAEIFEILFDQDGGSPPQKTKARDES